MERGNERARPEPRSVRDTTVISARQREEGDAAPPLVRVPSLPNPSCGKGSERSATRPGVTEGAG